MSFLTSRDNFYVWTIFFKSRDFFNVKTDPKGHVTRKIKNEIYNVT